MSGSGGWNGERHRLRHPSRLTVAIVAVIGCIGAFTAIPSAAVAAASGGGTRSVAAPSPSPATENAAGAMEAITRYDEAFVTADCDLFVAVTTVGFRNYLAIPDCETFVARANGRSQVIEPMEFTPASIGGTGRGTIAALVHVQFRSHLDAHGAPVPSPVLVEFDYRYHLVHEGGAWKIEEVHDLTGRQTEGLLNPGEQEAVDDLMVQWRAAYSTGDCDALMASTTAGFREAMEWPDCATFQQHTSDQNAYCPMDVHQEDIRFHDGLDEHNGEILLDVVEVCTIDTDENGDPIDPPYQSGAPYRYHLLDVDGAWLIAEGDDRAAAEDDPDNANERAAIETMRAYNLAWEESDCLAFAKTSTEELRIAYGVEDCASFSAATEDYTTNFANFTLTPTDIERTSSSRFEIKSHETYNSLKDAEGNPVDPPIAVDEYWVYTVDLVQGSWVVSDIVMLV